MQAEEKLVLENGTEEEINTILFQHQHLLDLQFANYLPSWVNHLLSQFNTPEDKGYITAVAGNMATHIQEFSHGNRAYNMEIAFVAYNKVLNLCSRQDNPLKWAQTQINLGNAYCQRIKGKRGNNRLKFRTSDN